MTNFDYITTKSIRRRIVGTDAWQQAAAATIAAYDDEAIRELIPSAVREFEREAQFAVAPVRVVMDDDGTYTKPLPQGADAESAANASYVMPGYRVKRESPLPFFRADSFRYLMKTLPIRPVQKIYRLRLLMGQGYSMQSIPVSWLNTDTASGRVNVQPVMGNVQTGGFAQAYALILAGLGNQDYIPHCMAYDYDAGLPPGWHEDYEWADVLRALQESVAIQVLEDIAQTFDAGKTGRQLSGGGFSQTENYTRFNDRIQVLTASRQKTIDLLAAQETPILMEVA